MKKFTKIMLSVAAVTAVSTAMAISAMAAVEGTYDAATGKVTLTGVESSGDQQTLLVLTKDNPEVTEDIIAQIDQDTAISEFVLKPNIESATYYVRIGGTDGTLQKYTLVIGSEQPGGTVLLVGDCETDGFVDTEDAVKVLRHDAGILTLEGDEFLKAAYCDGDYFADTEDAVRMLRYDAGAAGSDNAGIEMEIPAQS